MMPRDTDAVKDVKLARATAGRVWTFARPYRGTIIVFLVAILFAALLGVVPPLVVRRIIDDAIPNAQADGNRSPIWWLAAIAVAAALIDAVLQIVQRWCSARVGEGLIADLRRALYAKVQRLPIAFFTRTPTGAITSRLNNDVVGAQTAVTSTLGSVVSNVIVLATTLTTMLVLEWRLTLLTLVVLPLFVIPARRVGRRLQDISREQMTAQRCDEHPDDRAVQRVGGDARQTVRVARPRERDVRLTGQRCPGCRRASGDARAGVLRRTRIGRRRRYRGHLRNRRPTGGQQRDRDRHAGRPGGAGHPRLPTPHRAHERTGRPDDLDGVVRAGVRGARHP